MPRRDWAESRQRLLDAAIELFSTEGTDVRLEQVAQRAGLGPSTLYRHFPNRDELALAVMDQLIKQVTQNAAGAAAIEDPVEAFRYVFTHSCGMTPRQATLFADLAAGSDRAGEHAQELIASVLIPSAARLRQAGRLRTGISDDDLAFLVRMVEVSNTPRRRAIAQELILEAILTTRAPADMSGED